MLRGIIADFRAAGHSVTTILDPQLAAFNPPLEADTVLSASSSEATIAATRNVADSVDATYVIAPESNRTLESIVKNLEGEGVRTMNSSASAIVKVANKGNLYEHLRNLGLSTPDSLEFGTHDDIDEIARLVKGKIGFPAVFKPASDTGCGGLSIVKTEYEAAEAVTKIAHESSSKRFLAQELVGGVPASVSLLSTSHKAVPLSLNGQKISLTTPEAVSSYNGGIVPLESPIRDEALAAARLAVEHFQGLRGYVGVDLMLTDDGPVIIEINPRLTTSYVGLRELAKLNPAQAMIDAVFEQKLPTADLNAGCAYFSKIKTTKPSSGALTEIFKMKEVIAPPFPISSCDYSWALVCSNGATPQEAKLKLGKIEKRLIQTCLFGS